MPFYARAWRKLLRHGGKTLFLGMVLFVAAVLFWGTMVIEQATEQAKQALATRAQAKLVCEAADENQPITADDITKLGAMENVAAVLRETSFAVALEGMTPLTQSSSSALENTQAQLTASDNFTCEGPFADGSYRLTAGTLETEKHGVIMNANLAVQNGLTLGDTVTIVHDERRSRVTICGLYVAGSEEKQSPETLALARVENQLFVGWDTVVALGVDSATRVSVVSSRPQALAALANTVQETLGAKVSVTTADQLYQQVATPLEKLSGVVRLLRAVTIGVAMILLTLLLAMWLRGRRRELAVLRCMGISKWSLVAQILLEGALVFFVAAASGSGVVAFVTKMWGETLLAVLGEGRSPSLTLEQVGLFFAGGGAVVLVASILAMLPMLLRQPAILLSEMEE